MRLVITGTGHFWSSVTDMYPTESVLSNPQQQNWIRINTLKNKHYYCKRSQIKHLILNRIRIHIGSAFDGRLDPDPQFRMQIRIQEAQEELKWRGKADI
jgi:hypothetical protein